MIGIKLAVARSQRPDEMVYDDHLDQFQNITNLARTLADSATGLSDITISLFSYRYSVLPALLWSAAKCRHWQVHCDIFYIMYKRPKDDYGSTKSTDEQIRELKEVLIERDKQTASLTALVEKLMADLKQHGEYEEILKKKIQDLEQKLEDRQQFESSSKEDSNSPPPHKN